MRSFLLLFLFTEGTPARDRDRDPKSCFLRPSLFPGVPPTIRFTFDPVQQLQTPPEVRQYLKWRRLGARNTTDPELPLGEILTASGFSLTTTHARDGDGSWIGAMSGSNHRSDKKLALLPHQKIYRIPGFRELGNKARMWRNLKREIGRFGRHEFGFVPETYELPEDETIFAARLNAADATATGEIWLAKSPGLNALRGIVPVRSVANLAELPTSTKESYVLQKYIADAYVADGQKVEVRLQILTTGFDPLRIYVLNDWVARLGAKGYSPESLDPCHMFTHWGQVNPIDCGVRPAKDNLTFGADGLGMEVWNKSQLFDDMTLRGIGVAVFEERLHDAVVKTVLSSLGPPSRTLRGAGFSRYNAYQLWAVDFAVDSSGAPFMLEFNSYPSMRPYGMEAWWRVKRAGLKGALNTVGFHLPPELAKDDRASAALNAYTKRNCPGLNSTKMLTFDPRYYEATEGPIKKGGIDLANLSQEDVRVLMQVEDELARARRAGFTRLYPTASATAPNDKTYLRLSKFDSHFDKLVYVWEKKYGVHGREVGRQLLREMAARIDVPP